jgi:hypothetical protein
LRAFHHLLSHTPSLLSPRLLCLQLKETGFTYVLPKNLLRKFICVSDLRTQVSRLFAAYPRA